MYASAHIDTSISALRSPEAATKTSTNPALKSKFVKPTTEGEHETKKETTRERNQMYLKAPMGAIAIDYRAPLRPQSSYRLRNVNKPSHFKATFCLLNKNVEAQLAFSVHTEKMHLKLYCLSKGWLENTEHVSG